MSQNPNSQQIMEAEVEMNYRVELFNK
jgi:hypothetical protein